MLVFRYQMKETIVAKKQIQRGKKFFDKDMKEMLSMMKIFNPYMYEPKRDVSACSDESDVSDFHKNESEECSGDNVRVGNLGWCKCGNLLVGKREKYMP